MPGSVFTTRALAQELGVVGQRVAGWRTAYPDAPTPSYSIHRDQIGHGEPGWSVDDIQAWKDWREARGL